MIHLHVHDTYSLLDGYGKPEAYIKRCKEINQKAIAITNHGNVDGAIKWTKECKKNDIKPIIGCEMYIVPSIEVKNKGEKRGHITVLVKNLDGWKSLLRMISISNLSGFYNKPRIDYQTIYDFLNDGLIIMTACSNSFLKLQGGEKFFYNLVDTIPNNIFLEVMPHQFQDQYDINTLCLDLSNKTNIPLVASNDCHYVLREQSKTQEVLLAIQRKAKWKDPNRWKFGIEGLHLKDDREMKIAFKRQKILSDRQITIAMNNTHKIADMIDFEIPKLDIELPLTKYEKSDPISGKNSTADELLDFFCRSTLYEGSTKVQWNDEYEKRYKYEFNIIKNKNFSRYFLIIYELLEFCRRNNISYGPGRGSVGGSLIAYLLGITEVDPLKWGTLFERFINPDRIDYPDIDIDFDRDKTYLIKKHLEDEYGEFNIATINTFGKLESRAIIRDIGRVFELNNTEVDKYAKSITNNIENSLETAEGKEFSNKYPEEFKLIQELEGQIKSYGQHAAGLIVNNKDLRTSSKCALRLADNSPVINWDMGDSEYAGLIKIDVLKLGTLTILDECKRLIKENHGEYLYYHEPSDSYSFEKTDDIEGDGLYDCLGIFDWNILDFNDANVYDYISKGETAGIFQLTGYDCTRFCIDPGVKSLEDISAIIAIARPGPKKSGMADLYVQRKKGQKWESIHPIYEEITKDTYGVMVYQEQMMKAMTDLAGFSGSDSDRIRKIIGKKRDPKEFEPFRDAFLKGCEDNNTLSQDQASKFWEGLIEWAGYGFNLAHSIEYAMIAYYTSWAKFYYPAEFTCAYLTHGGDTDAAKRDKSHLIEEAEAKGMYVVTPKVGISDPVKWIVKDNNLFMPFVEIKGIGEKEAHKCPDIKPIRGGFFTIKTSQNNSKNNTRNLLTEIQAFDPDPNARPENPENYFSIDIGNISDKKDIPQEVIKEKNKRSFERPKLEVEKPKIEIIKKNAILNNDALDCYLCDLRKEAYQVVPSSIGIYNSLVLGESPGFEEDLEGRGFVGKAGDKLWKELGKHNIIRRMLHVGNICKCYPKESRTPSHEQADLCFNKWMIHEIKSMDCKLVLGLGGTVYYTLTGNKSGITKASGKIEWVDKISANVVWCVHPSYVLRNGSKENIQKFEEGIKLFSEYFNKGIS